MPLSKEQRDALAAEAKRRGIDEAKLIAAAERELGADQASTEPKPQTGDAKGRPAPAASTEQPKPLYQYHLPFVTVNEVRTVWLGLAAMSGGEENAAKYAARQFAEASKPTGSEGDGQP